MKTLYAQAEPNGTVALLEGSINGPSDHELLLKAQFSSLSQGTEHSLMSGHILPLPQHIGYSLCATVQEVGASVTQYKPGDVVVATARHANYQLVDQRLVTPVPPGVDLEQAAFFNLAHTALYAIRRSQLQLGEPALILGQGLVGSLTAQLARIAGAAPVIVTDVEETRLAKARSLGVPVAINAKSQPDDLAAVINDLGLGGIPVIFEATGLRQPLEEAVEHVSERGRIMMMSTVHGNIEPKITQALMMKGATLIGGYINSKPFSLKRTDIEITGQWPPRVAPGSKRYANQDSWTSDEDIRAILNLLRYGSLDIGSLISHRFSPSEIPQAYSLIWNKDRSLLGGVIDWRNAS